MVIDKLESEHCLLLKNGTSQDITIVGYSRSCGCLSVPKKDIVGANVKAMTDYEIPLAISLRDKDRNTKSEFRERFIVYTNGQSFSVSIDLLGKIDSTAFQPQSLPVGFGTEN